MAEWTTKGNIDPELLTLEVLWDDTPHYTKITQNYRLAGEIVRADVHVMGKYDMPVGAEQAALI